MKLKEQRTDYYVALILITFLCIVQQCMLEQRIKAYDYQGIEIKRLDNRIDTLTNSIMPSAFKGQSTW